MSGRRDYESPIDVRSLPYRQDQYDLLLGRRTRLRAEHAELAQKARNQCEKLRLNYLRQPHLVVPDTVDQADKLRAMCVQLVALQKKLDDYEEHLVDMRQLEWKDTLRGRSPYTDGAIAKAARGESPRGIVEREEVDAEPGGGCGDDAAPEGAEGAAPA